MFAVPESNIPRLENEFVSSAPGFRTAVGFLKIRPTFVFSSYEIP